MPVSVAMYESEFGPVMRNTPIVYTGGTFDLLHVGHLNLLSVCRKIAGKDGKVIVALNSDEFVEHYKGEHPVNNYRDREKMLCALHGVDYVIEHTDPDTSMDAINRAFLHAEPRLDWWFTKFIVIGDDWAKKDYYKQMGFTREWLAARRISLLYTPYTEGISSSKLRRHLVD